MSVNRWFALPAPLTCLFLFCSCAPTPDVSSTPPGSMDPNAPLRLSSISPAQGWNSGGPSLLLSGQRFVDGTQVTINGAPARDVSVVSWNLLRLTAPANPLSTGFAEVVVNNPDGQSISRSDLFTYVDGRTIPLASRPGVVVSGDWNGDGNLDLAVAAGLPGKGLSILVGDGTGNFALAGGAITDPNPSGLIAADFNRDGKTDLAASCQGDLYTMGSVTVLFGDGAARFDRVNRVTESTLSFWSSAFGDWNGDGAIDLFASGPSGIDLVLRGNGLGAFATARTHALSGNHSPWVVSGDVNGDGHEDVVLDDYGSLYVMLGDGAGNFSNFGSFFSAGTSEFQLSSAVMADWNGDGKNDLAVSGVGKVYVLFGTGMGTFGGTVGMPVGSGAQSLIAVDLNGDKHLDLVNVNSRESSISVLLGDGAGGFSTAMSIPVPPYPVSVTAGDFNKDKQLDLAVTTASGPSINVLLGPF